MADCSPATGCVPCWCGRDVRRVELGSAHRALSVRENCVSCFPNDARPTLPHNHMHRLGSSMGYPYSSPVLLSLLSTAPANSTAPPLSHEKPAFLPLTSIDV